MKLNKTLALALHRAMWTDMQTELGDNPSPRQRANFKDEWIKEHFPNECVMHNCFLCEYAFKGDTHSCCACPIRWPGGHCSHPNFSYCTAPISEILALPEKNKKLTGLEAKYTVDETEALRAYYTYREALLSKASGLPGSVSVEDHVKAIQEKAMQRSTFSVMYSDAKTELAKASGLPEADGIIAHIKAIQEKAIAEKAADVIDDFLYRCEKYPDTPSNEQLKKRLCAIQEKAVEEYFKKTPGAKLVSMDVDEAFKQYAKEQTEPYRKSCTLLVYTLNKYKDKLSEESGLDRDRPVDDHIHEIVKDSKEIGAAEERDRIQEKIYEVLLS